MGSHAVNVSVIGEFNDWDETKDKMKRGRASRNIHMLRSGGEERGFV